MAADGTLPPFNRTTFSSAFSAGTAWLDSLCTHPDVVAAVGERQVPAGAVADAPASSRGHGEPDGRLWLRSSWRVRTTDERMNGIVARGSELLKHCTGRVRLQVATQAGSAATPAPAPTAAVVGSQAVAVDATGSSPGAVMSGQPACGTTSVPQAPTVTVPSLRAVEEALTSTFRTASDIATSPCRRNQLVEPVPDAAARDDFVARDSGDVVYKVKVYTRRKKRGSAQEFLVLGSQPLSALRDKIYCLSDHLADAEHRVSSYILIGDTCYDDMRKPGALRLSKEVVAWAHLSMAESVPDFVSWGELRSGNMESTAIGDVPLKLGAHYLYCHQGDCEHILVFSDARASCSVDAANALAFPVHTYQAVVRHRECSACKVAAASCICYGDRMSSENPAAFCADCYHALHYTQDGELLADDFEVFPYYHEYL